MHREKKEENLTNEKIRKRFNNPFDLVNYAIHLAEGEIKRGNGSDGNVAYEVVLEITEGKDLMRSIEVNRDSLLGDER